MRIGGSGYLLPFIAKSALIDLNDEDEDLTIRAVALAQTPAVTGGGYDVD